MTGPDKHLPEPGRSRLGDAGAIGTPKRERRGNLNCRPSGVQMSEGTIQEIQSELVVPISVGAACGVRMT